jgi:PII-like signaling protein
METTNKEAYGAKPEQIREFTEDEQTLFENFAVTKKIKKQIIHALDEMSLAAYTGNVVITGDAGLDTFRMAKNLVKEYQIQDPNFSGKIAKISGEKINEKNIKEIFDKLDNGGIIIEKANGMSEEKLYEMSTLLNQENIGIIVILVDTKKEITKLLEKQAMIADYFNIRIDLMEMDVNALVAYAKNYALALEYAIDELGTLALYTRIANMQSGNHVVTKDEVRDIIDEAIYKSKRSKIKTFVDILFSRRYDSEDMIVLKERDFM